MTVRAVCGDWNGTLLDDVERCLRVMNLMLAVLASATQGPLLAAQLRPHAVAGSFDEILSITDVHRASKRDVIATWLRGSGYAAGIRCSPVTAIS